MAKHWARWVLAGSALTLAACSGGGTGGGTSGGGDTQAAATADQLVIQPIQVCDDVGTGCTQLEFFQAVVDKVWAQAGITVTFLPPNRLNDSTYLSVSDSEFTDLSFTGGPGAYGRHPSSTRDTGPINIWFVDTIEAPRGFVQYGNAWIGANGVLISDDIYPFSGTGRIDVLAHEIGHNLGLRHTTLGAGPANNIMSDGSRRAIPTSVDDITPDGARLGQLTGEQIRVARSSGLLTSAAGVASLLSAAPDRASGVLPQQEADKIPAVAKPALDVPDADPKADEFPVAQLSARSPTQPPAAVPEPGTAGVWLGIGVLGLGLGRYGKNR